MWIYPKAVILKILGKIGFLFYLFATVENDKRRFIGIMGQKIWWKIWC